ncbi:MAG: LysR substrate-binding domain-containing protein [Gammaproteobacteria bacterium]|nr:LysR substrate-binding domain-containing protein [Gammaproteobacteria bacterium]
MNLRDLRYLVAVAEHRHFGRAAAACFVSQPTLSTQLKKLEQTLGVTLIERTNRQVMLTPVGESIVAQAERVLGEVNRLVGFAEEHRDPLGGEFRLGIIPTVAPYLLPRILGPVRDALPNLKIHLTEAQTAVIARMLREGNLDAVILALPLGEDNIVESTIYREPFYLAVSSRHAKAGRESVSVLDLDDEQVLLLEDGHCLRDQALEVCKSHNAVENTNFRATSLETLRQMVAANVGATLMPELAVSAEGAGVSYIPFDEPEPPSRTIGIAWRGSSPRVALLDQMTRTLRAAMGGTEDE